MANSQPYSTVPEPRPSSSRTEEATGRTTLASGSDQCLNFLVCVSTDGETIVMQADGSETAMLIHEKVQQLTGIPVVQQKLTYGDKELNSSSTLASCSIQPGSTVYLARRIPSVTTFLPIETVMDFLINILTVEQKCRLDFYDYVTTQFKMYLDSITLVDYLIGRQQLQVFMESLGPSALVMLHGSSFEDYRKTGYYCIKGLLNKIECVFQHDSLFDNCIMVLKIFCRLLRGTALKDGLYLDCLLMMKLVREKGQCRITKRRLMVSSSNSNEEAPVLDQRSMNDKVLSELTKYAIFWATRLTEDLKSSIASPLNPTPLDDHVGKFTNFFKCWLKVIKKQVGHVIPVSFPLDERVSCSLPLFGEELELFRIVYSHLLDEIENGLKKIEELLATQDIDDVVAYAGRSHYLTVLRELYRATNILLGAEEQFWRVMKRRKLALCALIDEHVTSTGDIYDWLLKHKDKMGFEVRRQLSLLLFADPSGDENNMVIDRSQLFADSFAYIVHSEADSIKEGLYIEFKNEEATGFGVLREWFCLVCKDLFNQQKALFLSCPNDHRRFYPNPASKAIPEYQKYFAFSGRMIALALMHTVQVGIRFDRSFFVQLSGMSVSLEDIRDADPVFYNSCKIILEMEASILDSDALGLSFVSEVEHLGLRSVLELCPGGENVSVNNENKEEYIKFLIQHRFVTSRAEQVANFAEGFGDILLDSRQLRNFFMSLKLKDLDWMLGGSEGAISIQDWKAHTDYSGYNETDSQILWFWKIVEEMSPEQKTALLFYWTSVKYLPVEGFIGLDSRLSIEKELGLLDCLPTSHTCFYQLCFPPYPTMDIMQDRLRIITQEHFCNSFGFI